MTKTGGVMTTMKLGAVGSACAALLMAGAISGPVAASAKRFLTMQAARAVAVKVQQQELVDAFDLQAAMHGPFSVGKLTCERRTSREVMCSYIATGQTDIEPGRWNVCSIDVRVRLRVGARKPTWTRRVAACSLSSSIN